MKKKFKLDCAIAKTTSQGWYKTVGPDALDVFLASLGANDRAVIEINSPGGDVVAGLAMANAIKNCKAEITAHIVGVAASMASVIACACDKVQMEEASFLMIHNPWTISMGDAETLRHEADVLEGMRSAMMCFYKPKFPTLEEATIAEMCDNETWLTASEAIDAGFLCEVIPCTVRAAATVTNISFARMPDAAKAFLIERKAEETTEGTPAEGTPTEGTPTETTEGTPAETTEGTPTEGTPAETTEGTPVEASASWEARYKGASKKINELVAKTKEIEDLYKGEIATLTKAHNARIAELEGDLETANAELSRAVAARDEALEALATTREQAENAKKAHAALAGGVLVPNAKTYRTAKEIGMDPSLSPAEKSRLLAQGEYR